MVTFSVKIATIASAPALERRWTIAAGQIGAIVNGLPAF